MLPDPPRLFEGEGVTRDSAGDTLWKMRNGVRPSGMPGHRNSLTHQQMCQISGLLTKADKLLVSVQQLKQPVSGAAAGQYREVDLRPVGNGLLTCCSLA